jgi:hypothetical protein
VPELVKEYMEGKTMLDKYITHTMPFDQINEAFDLLHSGEWRAAAAAGQLQSSVRVPCCCGAGRLLQARAPLSSAGDRQPARLADALQASACARSCTSSEAHCPRLQQGGRCGGTRDACCCGRG